jgi:hypothetical protein
MRKPGHDPQGRHRSRTAAAVLALAGAAAGALFAAASLYAGSGTPGAGIVVRPGEVLAVEGTNVVCTARRRDGVTGLECESRPRMRGTLGARVTPRRVAVYQFVGARKAKTLYSARQRPNGETAVCGGR